EPGESALLRVLSHPLVQRAEGLCATAKEDGAEVFEIVAEAAKRGPGVLGESRVLALHRDSFERAKAANEILVRQRLLAEVIANHSRSGPDLQLAPPVAPEKLAVRERASAVHALRLDELEARWSEHLGQLRCAPFEQFRWSLQIVAHGAEQ